MLTSTHRTRSSISCTIPAESIEIYPNRGAFERPFYLRLRPTPFLPLARRNLSLRDDLEWEIRRMFKVAKGRQSAASKPDIWAEGKQFAPLDPMLLARVTAIIARRSAAHIWTKGSDLGADLSLAIEEGLWARAVSKLGRATAVLPSRAATARLMARLSRMQRRASSQVDHHRICTATWTSAARRPLWFSASVPAKKTLPNPLANVPPRLPSARLLRLIRVQTGGPPRLPKLPPIRPPQSPIPSCWPFAPLWPKFQISRRRPSRCLRRRCRTFWLPLYLPNPHRPHL